MVEETVGWTVGLAYAEAFIPYLPDVYNFLPVGDHRLGWSKEAHTESFKRVNLMVTRQKKFLGKF